MTTPHVLTPPADMSVHEHDGYWVQQALVQAKLAWGQGEVPVGVVVVRGNEIVGMSYNVPIGTHDPSAYVETCAPRQAVEKPDNYCLPDCEVSVTLKPRVTCTGAVLRARVVRVAYGAPDPRTGVVGSTLDLSVEMRLGHQIVITGSVPARECGDMLRVFFTEHCATQKAAHLTATESDESAT